jgi:hypothetical protein
MGEQVMTDGHRLRALQVGVAGHHPTRVLSSLGGERVDDVGDGGDEVRGRETAVQAQVQRDLVVARASRMQSGSSGCDLGQPAFDGCVDVLVCVAELEFALVQLALDVTKAALDQGEA